MKSTQLYIKKKGPFERPFRFGFNAASDKPITCSYSNIFFVTVKSNYLLQPKIEVLMGCFIKYSPILSHNLGYDRSALVLDRLEYWFSKCTTSFYKFLEPCNHPCYREGDSLQEELCVSRKIFNKAFDLIGVRYKSKTAFTEEEDPFKGKLYAMYMDRQTHKTYFVRNDRLAASILEQLFSPLKKIPANKDTKVTAVELTKKGRSRNNLLGHSPIYKDKQIHTSSSSIKKSNDSNLETKKEEEMIDVWKTEVGEFGGERMNISSGIRHKLYSAFQTTFHNSMDSWKEYCRKIASSKFLMGEGSNKHFKKAWLSWAIKHENVEKINNGGYTLGDRETGMDRCKKEKELAIRELEIAKELLQQDIESWNREFDIEKARVCRANYLALNAEDQSALETSFKDHIKANEPKLYEVYESKGLNHPILEIHYEFFWRERSWETHPQREEMERKNLKILENLEKKIQDIQQRQDEMKEIRNIREAA